MRQISRTALIALALIWIVSVIPVTAQTGKPAAKPKTGAASKTAIPTKNPVAATPESIAAGEVVYRRFCRSCHGPMGKGDGGAAPEGYQPADFTDAKWDHGSTDVRIFNTIETGVGPDFVMEGWGNRLKDPDVWNVINYIRTLGPKNAKR